MTATIGFVLAGIIAAGIVIIGARFFYSPYAAASGYGVSVMPRPGWDAYLSVKGVRDIVSGIIALILIANKSASLLAWFMLAAMIIPITDMAIVLRHRGPRAIAYGVHGTTALLMLVDSMLLLVP